MHDFVTYVHICTCIIHTCICISWVTTVHASSCHSLCASYLLLLTTSSLLPSSFLPPSSPSFLSASPLFILPISSFPPSSHCTAHSCPEQVKLSLCSTDSNGKQTIHYTLPFTYTEHDVNHLAKVLLHGSKGGVPLQSSIIPLLESTDDIQEFDRSLAGAMAELEIPAGWSLAASTGEESGNTGTHIYMYIHMFIHCGMCKFNLIVD